MEEAPDSQWFFALGGAESVLVVYMGIWGKY
jgi:hypothetical protein